MTTIAQMTALIADAELVARSRRRDTTAFGVLVERHQRLVFGVALARCHDRALAEDLAQEAFVTAWRELDRLHDVDRVGTWVAGIARNLAANAVRARARHQDPPELLQATVPTPEDEALEREDRELLHRALHDVPEAHRETLVLYYLEGESIAQIAIALGIREDLVKQRLSRGRRELRVGVVGRVESALSRSRLRPAFGAGVIAALATAGATKASAATKASVAAKGIALMSTKQLAVAAIAVLALVGGAIWIASRGSEAKAKRDPSGLAQSEPAATLAPSTETPARTGVHSGSAEHLAPKVRRLPAGTTREAMLETIRQAHAVRASANGAASTSVATGGAAPPALAEADMDKAYIRSAVREMIPMLGDCYSEGLERDPKLAGKIVIDFTIEGEPDVGGVVGESKIDPTKSDLADAAVRECMQETMYALQIDPPAGGGVVHVHYPFEFAPAATPPPPAPP